MRKLLMAALAGAAITVASPASATLHGFCAGNACIDNGTNTPITSNPPVFGFNSSPGGESGNLLIEILVPNNAGHPGSFTLTGALGNATATLFSSTPWTTGDLQTYLGAPVAGSTPANPIGNYIIPSGNTGFLVFQASIANVTLPGAPTDADLWTLGQPLATGGYILAYIGGANGYDATANSGALREIGRTPLPEPATWAMMLVGFGGIGAAMRRRRRKPTLAQIA